MLSLSPYLTAASGAYLQYDRTNLYGSSPNVTLTVGKTEEVLCVQPTGPVPTAINWYGPQGQLVSRDGGDEVNQARGSNKARFLNFKNYQQSQGGKYECRVTSPGNYSEKLLVCIGKCYTLGRYIIYVYGYCFIGHKQLKCLPDVQIVQAWLNIIRMV